jgi:uncharacterized protein (TIGR03435 family)
MKKLILGMLAILATTGSLFGQVIVGTWQGTLPPPPQGKGSGLRIVMKVSLDEKEALKAVMYSIDQGGQPINAGSFTLQGTTVKMAVPAIGGNYEGKLGADNNSITGNWTQGGPNPAPLNFTRATTETAWAIPEPLPPPKPMAADANPGFEVATIKPSDPARPGQSILVGRDGMFTTTNTTLNDLIIFAYGIHPRQLTNGQGWMETEKYDITAKPDVEGIPNGDQIRSMAQKLIKERFELVFHKDKKEISAYGITVAKNGPKLAKNESGGNLPGFGGRGPGGIGVRNSTMEQFAGFLQARIVDRPVLDETGLVGKFDFTLEWRPDQLPVQGPNAPPLPANIQDRPDLFTAMQEQLGLKLEATKSPVDILVIDKVSKPTDN